MDQAFQYIFENAFTVFFQVGMLVFGTICLAFGGLFCAGKFFTQKSGDLRVKARIIAIRAGTSNLEDNKSGMFYPVYEYIDQNGAAIRAESDWGSSSLTDKKIGTTTYVYVDPTNPTKVKTDMPILFVIGLFFLIFAAGLYYGALTLFPLTRFTIFGVLVAVVIGAYKFKKIIIPKHLRLSKEDFQKKIDARFLKERQALPLLGQQDVTKVQRTQDGMTRKAAPILLLISLGMIGGGFFMGHETISLTLDGVPAYGKVMDYKSIQGKKGTFYSPIVSYVDEEGTAHTFVNYVSASRKMYSIGEDVPVVYLPGQETAMIKGSIIRWFLPCFLWICGVLTLFSAFSSFNKSSRI